MLKALLIGASGKMGCFITDCAANDCEIDISAGFDKVNIGQKYPVFSSFNDITVKPEVIIDFSNVALLDGILDYATKNKIPAVLATTGYSQEQIAKIKKAAKVLGTDFDVEIIEKHHNLKIDAPSGTAIMLANAVNQEFNDSYNNEYDRHSKRAKRPKNEIGIHSVRGGTIVGEHEVIFAGRDEIITLSHSARSKEVFAVGAVNAAFFLRNKTPGMYSMKELVAEK